MDVSSSDRLDLAEQQASDRLKDIHDRLVIDNRQLYQHLALYLQVLREGLLPIVQRACFHLVTQAAPLPYAQLTDSQRSKFQVRIRQLVERCTCLLTVEQLVSLATQRQRQEQRRLRRQGQDFMQSLQSKDSAPDPSPDPGKAGPAFSPHSIHLGLDLPLSADLFNRGVPGLAGLNPSSPIPDPQDPDANEADRAPDGAPGLNHPDGSSEGGERPDSGPDGAFAAMETLMALAAETLEAFPFADALDSVDSNGPVGSLLPHDPQRLLQWWHEVDLALRHRLRNLSHALNVVLVREGMSQALLPVPLLEAVLAGQVEAMAAPANLLRVGLPNPARPDRLAEVFGVLLRQADLEFELPRLRTCRHRLEQHRRQVRRMAQHHRHWQRRRQSIQAQMLWEKDIIAADSHREPVD